MSKLLLTPINLLQGSGYTLESKENPFAGETGPISGKAPIWCWQIMAT